jgi:hypothetical protein
LGACLHEYPDKRPCLRFAVKGGIRCRDHELDVRKAQRMIKAKRAVQSKNDLHCALTIARIKARALRGESTMREDRAEMKGIVEQGYISKDRARLLTRIIHALRMNARKQLAIAGKS